MFNVEEQLLENLKELPVGKGVIYLQQDQVTQTLTIRKNIHKGNEIFQCIAF